jgi:hypothetical protein
MQGIHPTWYWKQVQLKVEFYKCHRHGLIARDCTEKKTGNANSNKYLQNFKIKQLMVHVTFVGNKGTKQKNAGLIQSIPTRGILGGVRNKKLQMQMLMKDLD